MLGLFVLVWCYQNGTVKPRTSGADTWTELHHKAILWELCSVCCSSFSYHQSPIEMFRAIRPIVQIRCEWVKMQRDTTEDMTRSGLLEPWIIVMVVICRRSFSTGGPLNSLECVCQCVTKKCNHSLIIRISQQCLIHKTCHLTNCLRFNFDRWKLLMK